MTDPRPELYYRPWWFTGGFLGLVLSLVGIFIKEQSDMAALIERENNHWEQILRDQRSQISSDAALGQRVTELGFELGRRIDSMNTGLGELQRQTSAIEGRMGEPLPELAPLGRKK